MILKTMDGNRVLIAILFFCCGLFLDCSEAPIVEREANRTVFVEIFSTPIDE